MTLSDGNSGDILRCLRRPELLFIVLDNGRFCFLNGGDDNSCNEIHPAKIGQYNRKGTDNVEFIVNLPQLAKEYAK